MKLFFTIITPLLLNLNGANWFDHIQWTPNLSTGNYGFVMVYDSTNLYCCDPWNPPYNPSYVYNDVNHPGINFVKAEAGPNDAACFGESYTLQGSGGLSSYSTYSWIPATGLSNPNIANPVILSPTITITYTLSIYTNYTSLNCSESCYSTDNVTITVNSIPIANAGTDQTICTGQTAYLSATGGTSYQWSTGASIANISVTPTVTTTYTVTVTNFGCTASDAVTVFVVPIPNANAGADQSICSGTTATLLASGGGAYFLWSTGAATASTNVTPAATTTYTVTVTNVYGCSASDDVTVSVIISPLAIFSANPEITCMGSGITFQCTGINDPCSTFNWDFNDGTTATGQNVSHVFTEPGYFNVSLNVTNTSCGSACTSTIITVIPSVSVPPHVYNDACCSEEPLQYSTSIPDLIYSGGNFTTSGPTNFITSGTYYVRGTITVLPSTVLTISGTSSSPTVIEFGPLGKIIVEPGGSLILRTCTLKGLSLCNTMWQGVEVWGNSSLSQNPSSNQGLIYITQGTKIKDAHTAVLLGKTKLYIPNPCNLFPTKKIQYDLLRSGGIIYADGSYFNNNAIDVKFIPYPSYVNVSTIYNCQFNGGALSDPGYLPSSSGFTLYSYTNVNNPNSYINVNNPLYPPLSDGRTETGIYMWKVKGITLFSASGTVGNTFTNMGNGIKSFDSQYNVYGSTFTSIGNGISIYNTVPSILNKHRIGGSTLTKNTFNIVNNAIWDEGTIGDFINSNIFGNPLTPQGSNGLGILMRNSSGFEISDNSFTLFLKGVAVENSSTGGGLISNRVSTSYNLFSRCKNGFIAWGNNTALQNRCNHCFDQSSSEYSGYDWYIWNQLANQGQPLVSGGSFLVNTKRPAGNDFANSPYKKITSLNNPFTYFYHNDPSYPSKKPTAVGTLVTLQPDNVSFDPNISCARKIPIPSDINPLKLMEDSLINEYARVYSNLDKGQTLQLITAINSNMSEGNLKTLLINASPLSDTVLIATINRTNQLSPGNFKNVMIPNSPVSDTVKPYLDAKLLTLPPGIAKQISDVQVVNPPYRTLTTIRNELNATIVQRTLATNELISRWITNDSVQAAIDLLKNESTDNAYQILASVAISDNNLVDAQNYLDSISSVKQDIQDWKALMQIIIDLSADSSTVFDMSSADEQIIRYYAYMTPATLVTSNAQAILRLVFGEDFPIDYPDANLKITDEDTTAILNDTLDYLGENIPNPFANNTIIPYHLPENTQSAVLNIYDISGQMIKTYILDQNSEAIEISLKEYQSGVYIYGISVNGVMRQYKRMVLIN